MPALFTPEVDFCMQNPTSPLCGNGPAMNAAFSTENQYYMSTNATQGAAPSAPTVQPVAPGTIVSTSAGPSGFMTRLWNDTPTFAKVIGAGVIAFLGYKHFTKPKPAALSGARRRRRW